MINHNMRVIFTFILLLPLGLLGQEAANDHEGHDHSKTAAVETDNHDDHEGHDHGETVAVDADDHDDHDENKLIVSLSPEAQKMAGIRLDRVGSGTIIKTTDLPGEVGFNEDRLVHISPRFAGIALEAKVRVGSYVKAGDVVAIVESNESMNPYSIKAPISGWIIERHVTAGEYVSGESSIYALADLSTVWVNLAVYPKDVDLLHTGQTGLITAIGTQKQVSGTISFITPIMDALTRSSTARVVLDNPNNSWRPGTFVHAEVVTDEKECQLVVEKDAVQLLNEKTVVFVVEDHDEFAVVEVIVGDSDNRYVCILSGLTAGTQYVAVGAFELKAKIVTSSLSGHAGHGH